MTFTYCVYFEDDSVFCYGKIRRRLVRARTPEKAMEKFWKKYGVKPLYAA